MNRTDIINLLAEQCSADTYLEIGLGHGENFQNIKVPNKISVDNNPNYKPSFLGTSDDFFRQNKEKFKIIFIDGLHHADQVEKDILNSLKCLDDDGYIICHDINPKNEASQKVPQETSEWNGDCWKAFVKLKSFRSDLMMFCIDTDHGVGIIKRGQTKKINLNNQELTYENLEKNRKYWLDLISVGQFLYEYKYIRDISILNNLALGYIADTKNEKTNFQLAEFYNYIGQWAAAISFYLRTVERSNNPNLQYESLIKAASCFEKQGTRNFSVKSLLKRALSILPKRPEAYYFLSRCYEKEQKVESWIDSYTYADLGMSICNLETPLLINGIDYYGPHCLIFQKAVSAWWIGLCDESRELFIFLLRNRDLDLVHRKAVIDNLNFFKYFDKPKKIIQYDESKRLRIKNNFSGLNNIKNNYSEAYQDMFVLTMLDGKREGIFLEIGAGHAAYGNNTYLLEKDFGWLGISIDIDELSKKDFETHNRKNKFICEDALKIDYDSLFEEELIDYLQIDCDPAETSLKVLEKVLDSKYKFKVITFEHDAYREYTPEVRENSRKLLSEKGYILIAPNVAPDDWRFYEDWWVNKEFVDSSIIKKMSRLYDATISAESYMLKS